MHHPRTTWLTSHPHLLATFGPAQNSLAHRTPLPVLANASKHNNLDMSAVSHFSWQFCAIVNINLAVVNTLPLPALDGGYLVLLAVEALRGGKKLPENFEQVRLLQWVHVGLCKQGKVAMQC